MDAAETPRVHRLSGLEHALRHAWPEMELPFAPGEYQQRLTRVRAGMQRAGLDVLWLTSPESQCYLTGYAAEWYQSESPKDWMPLSGLAVHVDHEQPIFFNSVAEAVLSRYHSFAPDLRLFPRPQHQPGIDYIVGELKAAGWLGGRVGFELWSHRPNRAVSELLQAAFEGAGAVVVDGTDIVRGVRGTKSPQELAYLEIADRIAHVGLAAAQEALRPGVTELEVYGAMVYAMAKAGGENPGITQPVVSGSKTFSYHALASRKQIMPGELVIVDVCGVYHRYHADLARTYSMGEPHPAVARFCERQAGVWDVVREVIRPGLPVRDFNRAVQGYYEEQGIWEQRSWVGGYEFGIAFPPDWVGPFYYDAGSDPGEACFTPGTVVNHESNFFAPHHAGISFTIDMLMFDDDEARVMGTAPFGLTVVE
jgi:Xaa-Pro aminopeptidase